MVTSVVRTGGIGNVVSVVVSVVVVGRRSREVHAASRRSTTRDAKSHARATRAREPTTSMVIAFGLDLNRAERIAGSVSGVAARERSIAMSSSKATSTKRSSATKSSDDACRRAISSAIRSNPSVSSVSTDVLAMSTFATASVIVLTNVEWCANVPSGCRLANVWASAERTDSFARWTASMPRSRTTANGICEIPFTCVARRRMLSNSFDAVEDDFPESGARRNASARAPSSTLMMGAASRSGDSTSTKRTCRIRRIACANTNSSTSSSTRANTCAHSLAARRFASALKNILRCNSPSARDPCRL